MALDPTLKELVDALTCMPGIGQKSAQRIALHLLERNRKSASHLGAVLQQAMETIQHCESCRNYTANTHCAVCEDSRRNQQLICVVETPADMIAIEHAGVFNGRYFVLMGRLSPLDGLGPEELGITQLVQQLKTGEFDEVIIATSATAEGEATAFYLAQAIQPLKINVSRIAHGVPMGGELEYIDRDTLTHALSRSEHIGQ